MSDNFYNPNGPMKRKKIGAKNRNKLLKLSLSIDAKPITLQRLESIQVNGLLPFEVFKENIGTIFPLILLRLASGDSIGSIERLLGMKATSLGVFIQKHPRLVKACNEARKIKLDRKAIEEIELRDMLS